MLARHAWVRAAFAAGALCGCVAAAVAAPVLNEFTARPAGAEGEWIEIANPGPEAISLEGWSLSDATNKPKKLPASAKLAPGRFLVLAAKPDSVRAAYAIPDSVLVLRPDGWPVLNDHDAATGEPADAIVLAGPDGVAVDSVAYFEAWLPAKAGVSLERVSAASPANEPGSWGWSLDASGGTPGRANSLARGEGDAPRGALDGPSRVEPSRRPAVFDFDVPASGTMALALVDREGREVAVLREPAPAPAVGRWVWGSDAPLPPRSGRYYLCLLWRAEGTRPVRACRPVWVAR